MKYAVKIDIKRIVGMYQTRDKFLISINNHCDLFAFEHLLNIDHESLVAMVIYKFNGKITFRDEIHFDNFEQATAFKEYLDSRQLMDKLV
jgi:hypothetical protein